MISSLPLGIEPISHASVIEHPLDRLRHRRTNQSVYPYLWYRYVLLPTTYDTPTHYIHVLLHTGGQTRAFIHISDIGTFYYLRPTTYDTPTHPITCPNMSSYTQEDKPESLFIFSIQVCPPTTPTPYNLPCTCPLPPPPSNTSNTNPHALIHHWHNII